MSPECSDPGFGGRRAPVPAQRPSEAGRRNFVNRAVLREIGGVAPAFHRIPSIAFRMRRASLSVLIVVAVASLTGCRPEVHDDVLARVGDRVITPEEFRLNYEFGHAHLRRQPDPRRRYLTYMIYEKIMAQEAERLGLDTAAAVVHSMRTLREELLIEQVFEEKVLSNIEVTNEEIVEAINRSAVRFKFRFIPALSRSRAEAVYRDVLEHGFDEVLERELKEFRDLEVPIGDVTSDYIKADEIDPAVLEAIRDLEIGTPSSPVAFDQVWYVFEVMDVRREFLAESDYEERAASVWKQLYNQKAMEEGARFVASVMEPKDVVTKREGFEILADALWDWYSTQTPSRNLLYYIDEAGWERPYTRRLVANRHVPLVTFDGGNWTIGTFLEHFTPGRYVLRAEDRDAFRVRLADIIALVVRDRTFLDMAERESLGDGEEFRRTVELWKDKWMYREYAKRLAGETGVPREDVVAELETLISTRYPVAVDEELLDTLDVGVSDKNRHVTVHLFKNNSNKQPLPIVDPTWASR